MNALLLEQLRVLEMDLAPLTHNSAILERVKRFAADLGVKTGQRQGALNLLGVLLQNPITLEAALEHGYSSEADAFGVLQGNLISTQSAFFMGERLTGDRRFIILSPTYDLVSQRRAFASFLEVKAITADTLNAGALLNSLTSFKRSDAMYLPPLEIDLERGILGFGCLSMVFVTLVIPRFKPLRGWLHRPWLVGVFFVQCFKAF